GQVYSLFRGLEIEIILIIMAQSSLERADSRIKKYLSEYRFVSAQVTGEDLKEMGLPPGPQYKTILNELLSARLDGRVSTKEEEFELVSSLVDTRKLY
ncbi:MAG: polya polymerase, partial [Candidatus Auribacterota bacterium]|nr:polya polymerase [Candidatus Auribacterota bacterium]